MKTYESYITELRGRLQQAPSDDQMEDACCDLFTEPTKRLHQLVHRNHIKNHGAFFTEAELATRLIELVASTITPTSILHDPTCGPGNLLVAAARHLEKLSSGKRQTFSSYERRLTGADIHPEFVEAARLRLSLLLQCEFKIHPSARRKEIPFSRSIASADVLQADRVYRSATHILLNPPFLSLDAPRWFLWRRGKVNSAAIVLSSVLCGIRPGTIVAAILPDVLRSGSSYERWREQISSLCYVRKCLPWGRFSPQADVDVFLLHLEKRRTATKAKMTPWSNFKSACSTVGDYFHVRVGSVVPHRDHYGGPWVRYAHTKNIKPWATLNGIPNSIRSLRTPVDARVAVLVRRTSSPRDKHRAVASLLVTDRPFLAENHLMILQPYDNSIHTARRLVDGLMTPETSHWINSQNRCRHLTVDLLRRIPFE